MALRLSMQSYYFIDFTFVIISQNKRDFACRMFTISFFYLLNCIINYNLVEQSKASEREKKIYIISLAHTFELIKVWFPHDVYFIAWREMYFVLKFSFPLSHFFFFVEMWVLCKAKVFSFVMFTLEIFNK